MENIKQIVEAIAAGDISAEEAEAAIGSMSIKENLGHTLLDLEREKRNGFPEIIYGAGKTAEQLAEIFCRMQQHSNVLASRVSSEGAEEVLKRCPDAIYHKHARMVSWRGFDGADLFGRVGIITAGTSDLAVAQETKITCEMVGCKVQLFQDLGVAGLHRMTAAIDEIRRMQVVIVIAGMEGALASVVGGLVSCPVIAVPTSVGYGANFAGLSALLGMLTSCSSGISVVNIDNGVGAACAAFRICFAMENLL